MNQLRCRGPDQRPLVDRRLAGGPYLAGDDNTIADIAAAPTMIHRSSSASATRPATSRRIRRMIRSTGADYMEGLKWGVEGVVCEHRWFEDRAPMCTALVYVDDATSRLMLVRFGPTESTFAYFEATREYLRLYGKPLAFYSDKASIFRVNRPEAIKGPGFTQFGRALYELNIDGICANTAAAAKGRVERAHLTLQDRLVKELRLEGISSIEAANAFMPRFIEQHNQRFAKDP